MSDTLNIPIPGLITANYIDKAKVELRDEFKSALVAQADLLKVAGIGRHEKALLRIEAVETALVTFKEDLLRVPTRLDERAETLSGLFNEKLLTINTKIDLLATNAVAMRQSLKEHTDTAFIAARELTAAYTTANAAAVTKTEAATNKEIDSIKTLIHSSSAALDAQITNLADRLNRSEGMFAGGKGAVAFIVTVVAAAGIYIMQHNSTSTGGADTKRVDDLISIMTEQNRQTGQRMDALSARLNQLTPAPKN